MAPMVHEEHEVSDEMTTILMPMRVERDLCCISLSLFELPTTAIRVADE